MFLFAKITKTGWITLTTNESGKKVKQAIVKFDNKNIKKAKNIKGKYSKVEKHFMNIKCSVLRQGEKGGELNSKKSLKLYVPTCTDLRMSFIIQNTLGSLVVPGSQNLYSVIQTLRR